MRLVMLMCVAALAAACGEQRQAYPPEFAANFRASCLANEGASAAYCDCVWRRIEGEIPLDDFIGFDSAARSNAPHPVARRIGEITRQCMAETPAGN